MISSEKSKQIANGWGTGQMLGLLIKSKVVQSFKSEREHSSFQNSWAGLWLLPLTDKVTVTWKMESLGLEPPIL